MWDEVAKYIEYFPSAVLCWVNEQGYPYSVRCKPQLDSYNQVIRVLISEHTGIQSGPAGMLCHKHDEWLWNLKSFTLRGTVEKDDLGWLFRPTKFIPGLGIGGPLQLIRSMRDARRNASQYLKRRGLDRPRIPWDKLAEVERNESATVREDR